MARRGKVVLGHLCSIFSFCFPTIPIDSSDAFPVVPPPGWSAADVRLPPAYERAAVRLAQPRMTASDVWVSDLTPEKEKEEEIFNWWTVPATAPAKQDSDVLIAGLQTEVALLTKRAEAAELQLAEVREEWEKYKRQRE